MPCVYRCKVILISTIFQTVRLRIPVNISRYCKELFDDIKEEWSEEPWDTNGREDYERIADGYYQMLQNALENLNTALKFFSQSRLNRKELQKCLQEARNDLYNNL